jgi:tRNA (guanine37-N1)-methyltransferase
VRWDVVTLFPEMIRSALDFGVTGRAVERGLVELATWNPRDYTSDRHRTVDDRPYGGGPGMVMKPEPLSAAIRDAREWSGPGSRVVYLSPQGRRLDQELAAELATRRGVILVAGRYEGVDERVLETLVEEEISIGDYVLSGGELAALVVIDAVTRLLPGVLGDAASAQADSFSSGLLDYPHFTRPEEFEGRTVPSVLLGGNHEAIRRWRLKEALGRTWQRRPELLAEEKLTKLERRLLEEYISEHGGPSKQEHSETRKGTGQ